MSDVISSGIGLIRDGLKRLWPEPMSKEKEAEVDALVESGFRNFVIQYEGSMRDYKDIPIIGPIVLLFRGLIRPGFTCLVGYLDYIFITGTNFTQPQAELIKAMTLITLFFWFGERAVKNSGLLEAISNFIKKK